MQTVTTTVGSPPYPTLGSTCTSGPGPTPTSHNHGHSHGQAPIGCTSTEVDIEDVTSLDSDKEKNCTAVLLMRYTMTRPTDNRGAQKRYSASSVIITTELVKLLVCVLAIPIQQCWKRLPLHGIYNDVLSKEFWKMSVPAACYTLQSNLLFIALANLEATLFQVTYQMKLLLTALLMVLMLGKQLTWGKWGSLFLLFFGIVLTQISGSKVSKDTRHQHLLTGLVAVVLSSLSSAFASVYFEKVLKQTSSSLAVKNIQLSIFSLLFAFPVYLFYEGRKLSEFFVGYDFAVSYLVFNQAAGGLLVALVIKYADNILKGFATAIAIVLSGVFSYLLLDFTPSLPFLSGAFLVVSAVGIYGMPDKTFPSCCL